MLFFNTRTSFGKYQEFVNFEENLVYNIGKELY
jgi:hypothetical protein